MLSVWCVLGVPGDLIMNSEFKRCRDGRPSDTGVRRNTVCGTTPSFGSSIVDVTLSASDSTSTLTREAKLWFTITVSLLPMAVTANATCL